MRKYCDGCLVDLTEAECRAFAAEPVPEPALEPVDWAAAVLAALDGDRAALEALRLPPSAEPEPAET